MAFVDLNDFNFGGFTFSDLNFNFGGFTFVDLSICILGAFHLINFEKALTGWIPHFANFAELVEEKRYLAYLYAMYGRLAPCGTHSCRASITVDVGAAGFSASSAGGVTI